MSRRHSEVCPGENCPRCQARIDDIEFPDPGADSDWQIGQDAYERQFDRQGGSL